MFSKIKTTFRDRFDTHHNKEYSTCNPFNYTMGSPIHIVSICMGKSIRRFTDACLTADPGVASLIPGARYHTFVEIDHEIISTVIHLLPLIYSRRVVVSYKRKYVHEVLVNRLLKPAQEKVWLSELTVPQ